MINLNRPFDFLQQIIYVTFIELPQLSENLNATADSATGATLTVSFLKWNQEMTGGLPPTESVL